MLMRADALDAHLTRGMKSLYTVWGDESLLVQESVDKIRRAARASGCAERVVYTVERGFDWSTLLGEAQSMSLFGERKVVELRIPSGKPGKDGADALKRMAFSAAEDPDTVTLITLPRLDSATQKSAWFATLSDAGVAVRVDSVERTQLGQWIGERLAAQQQRVAPGDAGKQALQFIVERVEGNLLAAHQEIQKLGLLYPPGVLTADQIQAAVMNVARYDVFKLNEAMLVGDVARLARMIDGLRGEGEATVLVLWAIAEEIRVLLRVRRGLDGGKPLGVLLRENRVWGPRERLIGPALKRLTADRLEAALTLAARLDRQVKGLSPDVGVPPTAALPANPWDGLFELAMQVAAGTPTHHGLPA